METETAATRVERGAALLDRVNPGWYERINLDVLDMWSTRGCVLGQLYGGYGIGLGRLGIYGGYEQGFYVSNTLTPFGLDQGSGREVANLWVAAVNSRIRNGPPEVEEPPPGRFRKVLKFLTGW